MRESGDGRARRMGIGRPRTNGARGKERAYTSAGAKVENGKTKVSFRPLRIRTKRADDDDDSDVQQEADQN